MLDMRQDFDWFCESLPLDISVFSEHIFVIIIQLR